MTNENLLMNETIVLAKRALVRINLLINQCDSWLPEEEGRKNMEKRILENRKRKKKYPKFH